MRSPVLFIVFNRPDVTRRVFQAIRAAKPARLYVAADGPRAERSGEAARCAEVRKIAATVDWPCEVCTLFREQNFGCKMGVSSAINWFFEHEPEGIILEDDVLPVDTFFEFCDEMLERYRDDDRVAMISGCNLVSNYFTADDSYFFSRYNHVWGWASWRRAWRHYDLSMSAYPAWRKTNNLEKISGGNRFFASYWRKTFDIAYQGTINAWSYPWIFACWRLGTLTIIPAFNQTQNLGFGAEATHTIGEPPKYLSASLARPLTFPLKHPKDVSRELQADASIDSKIFGITALGMMQRNLRRKLVATMGIAAKAVRKATRR